ncbi:MAG: hypothetical protein MMC33_001089 [Icmadophila ericetorum]|nr:hypothetical protein [Icmadophila ericetorum]
MLEVNAYDSKDFSVQCFKRVNNIEELLWNKEVRLGPAYWQQQPWAGMAKIGPYFLSRVYDLQQYFGIYHIVDTLIVLAKEFIDNFQSSQLRGSRFKASPFPLAPRILQLISILFLPDSKSTRVYPGLESVRKFWRNMRKTNVNRLNRMSELFMEMMVISLIENAYDEEPQFYIDTKDKRFRDTMPLTSRNISWFLSGDEQVEDLTTISGKQNYPQSALSRYARRYPSDTACIFSTWPKLALTHRLLEFEFETDDDDGESIIAVVKGPSCLACACQTSLHILEELNPGRPLDSTRAIIVA